MLPNTELIQSLDELERLFQQSTSPRDSKMHAKHALLELCGWIEEAEDCVIRQCAHKIGDDDLKKLVESRIKFNSAFDEDKFVPLLALVIGLTRYEVIKTKLTSTGTYFLPLISNINALKTPRNNHAHTHFEVAKQSINNFLSSHAPSSLKQKALEIYQGFCELERTLRKHRLL